MRTPLPIRFWLILVATCITLTCLVVVFGPRLTSQHHRGRPLQEWLVLLHSMNLNERAEAEAAVQAIGTNSVPTLIAWLSHHDSTLEKNLKQWLAKHGWFTRNRFSENDYHSKALSGFRALGTNGQSAVPVLRGLLADPERAFDAAYALSWVSPGEAERLAEKWVTETNRLVKARGLRLKQEFAERRVEQ